MNSSRSRLAAVLAGAMVLTLAIGAPAEARRGGSFGSRGGRTYSTPSQTSMSPGYVGPVQRSMTAPPAGYTPGRSYAPSPAQSPYNYGGGYQQPRSGFGRPGFGGGLLAGLATGGLLGAMMGHGFGGGWGGGYGGMGGGAGLGLLSTLFQLGLVALAIWLAFRFFRRRNQTATAGGYASAYDQGPAYGYDPAPGSPWGARPATSYAPSAVPADLPISRSDEQAFERLLIEVQDAFGREDYGALRERTTPEVMSYLSEELSQNATQGRRNEVSQTRLRRSEISEAWREGDADYATVALNYESADVMRDRQTGQVLQGDPSVPTVTTEIWTFVRHGGGVWKLSAIQETGT
jgi:predicted lipid-binding transport protein (Tim44 family)